jgi:hypothetical protein
MDFNEGFPYIEVANFDGWLVHITAHLRGKNLRKKDNTKLLTETGNFPTALSLLKRLKERFKSTVSRQLDVAHQ